MRTAISLVVLLIFVAGIILLQIFLSKRKGKWFGLVLPAISFLVSLVIVLSIVAYSSIGITSHSVSQDGTIVAHDLQDTRSDFSSVAVQVVVTFLVANIPTVTLLTIYSACREKGKRSLEIEKMQIQDLE